MQLPDIIQGQFMKYKGRVSSLMDILEGLSVICWFEIITHPHRMKGT